MSETFQLDIHLECVHLDDKWLSREDLTARITACSEGDSSRAPNPTADIS
ncbi:MAG: hypothetical protein KC620_16835 [Myxococcales bacterium]|nr:hypothetical protein [Myxococcales bacterium]